MNFAREIGVHFKPEAYRSAVVAHLRRPAAEAPSDSTQHGETNPADSESKAEDNTGSEATDEVKTASESDTNAKPSHAWELLQRWREELEQKQTRANTKAVPPSEQGHVDSSSTLDSASIRIQQRPPINVPEGTTTVRTLHGWVTIPSEWLEPDASPAELASLARLLGERP